MDNINQEVNEILQKQLDDLKTKYESNQISFFTYCTEVTSLISNMSQH